MNVHAYNKAFKRDLARVAFLVCVGFSVYGILQRLLYCVPAPLNAALYDLVWISNGNESICSQW
ncbi:hypothetical protein CGH19_23260 [Vibrio parahaemolyticus]|nr:hypothetical protein CGH19_23260 [Vibrio parahaemolyticus]